MKRKTLHQGFSGITYQGFLSIQLSKTEDPGYNYIRVVPLFNEILLCLAPYPLLAYSIVVLMVHPLPPSKKTNQKNFIILWWNQSQKKVKKAFCVISILFNVLSGLLLKVLNSLASTTGCCIFMVNLCLSLFICGIDCLIARMLCCAVTALQKATC